MVYCVLVVDDYAPWRRQICSALGHSSRWQVVGEASDGIEAVDKARALNPDIILLDAGLPSLDGIEAARRILAHHPYSRILFVSEHRSPDIVTAALEAGARGFVVKSDASRDLLQAMEATVEGERFLSACLGPRVEAPHAPAGIFHDVAFYPDEPSLLDAYARVAHSTLALGNTFVIMAGSARRDHLKRRLETEGIDVERVMSEGTYRTVDPRELIARFMVGGRPDPASFRQAAADLIAQAGGTSRNHPPRIVVCGECAPTLLGDGDADAAIQIEQLWDVFAHEHHVDTLCGYLVADPSPVQDSTLQAIRAGHAAVYSR